MAHHNTVFSQILKLVPRHEFETLAKAHHSGRAFRTALRWSQFVCLSMVQLTRRHSLRDIIENISAQVCFPGLNLVNQRSYQVTRRIKPPRLFARVCNNYRG